VAPRLAPPAGKAVMSQPMRVVLVALGSRGDVHPMLGLGRALLSRGHDVVLLTNPAVGADADAAGLRWQPLGDESDYRQTLAHPKLWHPVDGLGVMWRYLLRPALRPTVEALRDLAARAATDGEPQAPLVLASPMVMGARLAQEKFGIRLISTYTSPTLIRSVQDPLTIAHWRVPRLVPTWARRGIWSLLDRVKLDPLVKPSLEPLRAELGLPALTGSGNAIFDRWMHSPQGGVTLFPDWFAATPSDWPTQVRRGGFPLHGETRGTRLADADPVGDGLQRFLAAGSAPVVFMPGSAQLGTEHFFRSAIAACKQLGIRAILLGHDAASMGLATSATVWCAPYFPFDLLLPQVRAIVHHGGIGTCAQALRAGIAQLVWPQAYDQFDNAMRLERLGVGYSLPAGPIQVDQLKQRLGALLADRSVAEACAARAAQMAADSPLDDTCAWLESLE